MTSPPFDSTHGQTTSGVECNPCLWTAHTVKRRRAWHAIIAFGKHTQSNDVGRGMPSSPLGSTNGRTTSSVACHHLLWTSTHSRTASGVACHHCPLTEKCGRMTSGVASHHRLLTAHTVEQRQAWHVIIAFGQHTPLNDVGRGMPS